MKKAVAILASLVMFSLTCSVAKTTATPTPADRETAASRPSGQPAGPLASSVPASPSTDAPDTPAPPAQVTEPAAMPFVAPTAAQRADLSRWENENSWPMPGANVERTSWTPEEVSGSLEPVWFKPFEPYISQKVQIIGAYGNLYISTARGLYALSAQTGAEQWVYPTSMPLGHSPTIYNGVAYVGGFDRKIHAVDAITGDGLWTFAGEAGFQTNPLVVNGVLYAGNRDGYLYAIFVEGPNTGQLAWKYLTEGPILFSAAYKDGIIYFASNDSYAYALDAATGTLVWRSAQLPGAGFHSWWPVIHESSVIFSGSSTYRFGSGLGPGTLAKLELDDLYPNHASDPQGTLIGALGQAAGPWAPGTPTIDASPMLSYFAQKPWRRTVFVLDRLTGVEAATPPVLWASSDGSITRYPPVVGSDGVLYQQNHYMSDPSIQGGQIAGWKPGLPYISVISSDWGAVDEPHAAAAGGNLVYWSVCCDRQAGYIDVTVPNLTFYNRYMAGNLPPTGSMDSSRERIIHGYSLAEELPGYNVRYFNPDPTNYVSPYASFGGPNGVYGFHSDVNPPIPYNGRVFLHRSNAIIAFGPGGGAPVGLPMAATVAPQDAGAAPLGSDYLTDRLELEIQQILAAGHLRPGYISHGAFDLRGRFECGDDLVDYWHHPAETIVTLIMALPHISPGLQPAVQQYIQNEFAAFPPYETNHIGWNAGAAREPFLIPPEVEAAMSAFGPQNANPTFKNDGGWQGLGAWGNNPYGFYALWKYAELFGGAPAIFAASQNSLEPAPPDALLLAMPLVHNAFIAGYLGYLELEALAGQPESPSVRSEYERLLALRLANFTKDSAYGLIYATNQGVYCRTMSVASNFIFMVPELALRLGQSAGYQVQQALNEYEQLAPYWFVSFAEEGYAEDPQAPLYDAHAIFMAKAWIGRNAYAQLEAYLDVPAVATGDLYYIQKIVATLENSDISPRAYLALLRVGGH